MDSILNSVLGGGRGAAATAGPLQSNLHPRRGGRRAVPTILQMETTECGAARLAMILAHYGKWVPLEELRVRCGVSRDGSKASNVVQAARELGLVTKGVRVGLKRLYELRFPLIAHWRFSHFVVVEGRRGNRFHINDPAEGRRTVSAEEFDECFTGACLIMAPGPEFSQGGRRTSSMRGLLRRLGQARNPLIFAIAATAMLIVPGVGLATLMKVFVDEVLIPRNGALMTGLLAGLAITAVLHTGLTWLQQTCLARMEAKLAITATTRFFMHILTLPLAFFGQRHAGDLAARVGSNDRVAQMLSGQLAYSAADMLSIAVFGAVLFAYDPLLALAAFGMVSLNVAALLSIRRARQDGSRLLLKEQARVASASVNGLARIESIKADGSERQFFARWAGLHANAVAAQQSLGTLTGLLNVVPPLLSSLTTIVILGFGGYRVLEGVLTIGGLVAFQTLARNFSQPIERLVQFSANLQTIQGDIDRLDDVLNYAPEKHQLGIAEAGAVPAVDLESTGRTLVFENVTFGYNPKEPPLIEDISLELPPGGRVALVGASGSGKSTVGKLACRLLTPWSGTIRIGDADIAHLTAEQLSEVVAYVDQGIVLFDGSVRDNLTLWNPSIGDKKMTGVLRDIEMLDEVMSRPGKYDTPVGENGSKFSGGQRQLLDLGRAIISDPDIMVLDEARAALDPVTEVRVDANLRRRGIGCLIIAHRLSTIRDADEIIVLEAGRIVERGTHGELVAGGGAYAQLISMA